MRILIYGAGVIGCLYAILFSKAGFIYYWFSALYVTKNLIVRLNISELQSERSLINFKFHKCFYFI